jgi:hypothetical protein
VNKMKRTTASLGLIVVFSVLFLGALLAAPQGGPWSARAAFPAEPQGTLLVTNSGGSGPLTDPSSQVRSFSPLPSGERGKGGEP